MSVRCVNPDVCSAQRGCTWRPIATLPFKKMDKHCKEPPHLDIKTCTCFPSRAFEVPPAAAATASAAAAASAQSRGGEKLKF